MAGITWQWKEYPFGAEHWLKHRKGLPTLMSEEDMAGLGAHDAVYFGAVGDPRVPEPVEQAGALLWMRFYFDQYINLRPAKLLRGVALAARRQKTPRYQLLCRAREQRGLLHRPGARFCGRRAARAGTQAGALQGPLQGGRRPGARRRDGLPDRGHDRPGAERVIRYGFELAKRKKLTRVTVVHKANVLTKIYGLWIDTADRVAKESPPSNWIRHRGRHHNVVCPAPRMVPGRRGAQYVR